MQIKNYLVVKVYTVLIHTKGWISLKISVVKEPDNIECLLYDSSPGECQQREQNAGECETGKGEGKEETSKEYEELWEEMHLLVIYSVVPVLHLHRQHSSITLCVNLLLIHCSSIE